MIHPHSELRFVNYEIGFGVFATELIPRGTITWVFDPLDQIVPRVKASGIVGPLRRQLDTYSYQNGRGERILCWDHARFVNHSCRPTCLAPGFDLEIAVRDIHRGEEITDDYGALNVDMAFSCACGFAECRGLVGPGDFERYSEQWDEQVGSVFPLLETVEQPLWDLVQEQSEIRRILAGEVSIPSCRVHSLGAVNGCR